MLKILADFQMDQLWDEGFLQQHHADALYELVSNTGSCGSYSQFARTMISPSAIIYGSKLAF